MLESLRLPKFGSGATLHHTMADTPVVRYIASYSHARVSEAAKVWIWGNTLSSRDDKRLSYESICGYRSVNLGRHPITRWQVHLSRDGEIASLQAIKPEAARLLDQWAFLHPGELSWELFKKGIETFGGHGESREFDSIDVDELSFQDSLGVLARYSLIGNTERTGSFFVHVVVHDWSLYNSTLR